MALKNKKDYPLNLNLGTDLFHYNYQLSYTNFRKNNIGSM